MTKRNIGNKSGWGDLPPKEREEAMQQIGRDFPSHYRDVIEQYFRRLAAEEDNKESDDHDVLASCLAAPGVAGRAAVRGAAAEGTGRGRAPRRPGRQAADARDAAGRVVAGDVGS